MRILRKPSILICLSASLLALGTYLATVEVPVWIGNEYDPMHIYTLFFSFPLWILAFLSLSWGIVSGVQMRKHSTIIESRKPFLTSILIGAVALGFTVLASTFLPWVNVKAVNSGQLRSLSGVSLIGANYWAGDVMYLVFIGVIIAVLYIPLVIFLERESTDIAKAFLLLLSGICIVGSIVSVLSTESWSYSISFAGGFLATFERPAIGLVVAAVSAAMLIAFGLITTIKLAR